MQTVFKSAVSQIHADETLKQKTRQYLAAQLAAPAAGTARAKRAIPKRLAIAACTAVFLCAATVGAYAYYRTPVSYLSLDINPSVELGINHFGKVVSAEAYNADGKTILNGQDVDNLDVKDAVSTLVKSAAQKGFVAKDGSTVIAVTSETDDGTTAAELEDDAAQGADDAVKAEGRTATVDKENVALERRDEARKLGITPGKLNLIQKLQKLDPSITVAEYKDAKVTDIMKKFTELKKAAQKNQPKKDDSSAPAGDGSQTSPGKSAQDAPEAENGRPADKAKQNTAGKNQVSPDSSSPVSSDSPSARGNGNTQKSDNADQNAQKPTDNGAKSNNDQTNKAANGNAAQNANKANGQQKANTNKK